MRGADPVVTPPSRGTQDGLPPLDRGHHPMNNPGHGVMDPAGPGGLQQLRTGGFGSPPRQVPDPTPLTPHTVARLSGPSSTGG